MTIGPNTGAQRERIAILGGGIGALSAAWHLSSEPGWQERYDICVYQHGWRLGGSGAAGSTWYGFYGNAFSMLRAAHERLETAPAGWRDGLCQNAGVGIPAHGGGQGKAWPMVFPVLPGEPGTGSPATMWQMAMTLLGLVGRWLDELAVLGGGAVQGTDAGRSYRLLAALARTMPDDSRKHPAHQHLLMAQALDGMRTRLRAGYAGAAAASEDMLRLRACLETGSTVLKGLFADAVLIKGFDTINGTGLRAWLASHGGDPESCLGSWPVRAACESLFAHGGQAQDGGEGPAAEAGTVLRAVLRMGLGYKGSIAYDMPAGMG
ncbi:MAG: NAD(P)-binding protein, partial [Telluria sp.]